MKTRYASSKRSVGGLTVGFFYRICFQPKRLEKFNFVGGAFELVQDFIARDDGFRVVTGQSRGGVGCGGFQQEHNTNCVLKTNPWNELPNCVET